MTHAREAAPGRIPDASAALALAIAGVLPEGDAAPRLSYRSVGDGYDDARVVAGRVIAVGDGVQLGFDLPAAPMDYILLEPAAVPGSYRIPHMTWAGETVTDLRRRVMVGGGAGDHAGPEGVRIENGHGRPAVEFDVRGLAGGEGGRRIELLLQRGPDGAAAADAVAQLADRLSRQHALGHAGIARLGRELASASDRIGDVIDTVSGLPAVAAGQLQLGARLDARLDALEAAVEGRAAERSLAGLVAFIERTAAERVAAEAAAAEASARDLEGIRRALDELREQVDRVTNSVENVFWRRWLRRLRRGGR